MNKLIRWWPALLIVSVLSAGCGEGNKNPGPSGDEGTDADRGKYLLAKEPAGAKGVIQARKEVKDGEEVIVVGRVGGSGKPFVAGRASFTVVDLSLEPCEDDDCGNPWCSADRKELKRATTLVKFVDGEGKTLAQDAEKLLGLKILQTVVVRGQAKKDAEGNLTVLAEGIYPRPGDKK